MMTFIQKWGNSQGIRLPKFMLDQLSFAENEEVEITAERDGILIRKVNKSKDHKSLQQRLEEFYKKDIETIIREHGDYDPPEVDWGKPAGDEIW